MFHKIGYVSLSWTNVKMYGNRIHCLLFKYNSRENPQRRNKKKTFIIKNTRYIQDIESDRDSDSLTEVSMDFR